MQNISNAELTSLRARYPITRQAIYLDHAAVGTISTGVEAAMHRQATLHSTHIVDGRPEFGRRYTAAREAAARLVGAPASRISFIQNTSHGLSLLANGQDWQPGDNVVVPAMEFPSNYLPWIRLQAKGVEVRRWHASDGRITPCELSNLVDRHTRLVSVSAVQYYNGFRCDLAAFSRITRSHDALLVVDGTQAVGALNIDLAATGTDALVVSAHKWMLGPLGTGFMALSDRMLDRTEVTQLGWLSVNEPFAFRREIDLPMSAERFEPGTENASGLFGLGARLAEIEDFGAREIEVRILHLTAHMSECLLQAGLKITSPGGAGETSGILTFRHHDLDSDHVVENLKTENIFLSARHGSIRASPHYYNSEEEIEGVVDRIRTGLRALD